MQLMNTPKPNSANMIGATCPVCQMKNEIVLDFVGRVDKRFSTLCPHFVKVIRQNLKPDMIRWKMPGVKPI